MSGISCDVVVVGGGPAGSLASTYLAQRGYDVVLLEKQEHPRPTVGENLIPDFWKFCDAAGVSPRLESEGFVRKAGGTVCWGDKTFRIAFSDFGYTRPALHVERDCFDAILLAHARAAGVEVRERVTAERFEPAAFGQPVAVHYRHASGEQGRLVCRYVVDASGQRTLIGRQLGLCVPNEAFRFVAVWGYFKGSGYVAADGGIRPASDVRVVPPTTFVSSLPFGEGWGWSWHIPMRDSASVGLVIPVDTFRACRKGLTGVEDFFLRTCYQLPVVGPLLENATYIPGSMNVIRDYSYRTSRHAGTGFYLIGDAAGFIDPIFSIGVVLAMYGARTAAWAIDRSLRTPARAAGYQALFASQLESRIELSRRLSSPYYADASGGIEQSRRLMRFFGRDAQALMSAVTTLTGREANFDSIADEEFDRNLPRARIHTVVRLSATE